MAGTLTLPGVSSPYLSCSDPQIDLKNEPIPVVLEAGEGTPDDSPFSTFPFPNHWAVQDMDAVRALVTTTHDKWALRGEGTEPLAIIKLTEWGTRTAIGVAWNHALGEFLRDFAAFSIHSMAI